MIEIRQLSEDDFNKVIELSLLIFKPKLGKKDRFHNIETWREYFKQNGFLLGAFINGELGGYLFNYKREPDKKSLHCWLAGVAEEYRRQGILKKLMAELVKILKEKGYKTLTINTWPEKFPVMYAYLNKHGFEKYREEEREWEGNKTTKAFFRKNL